MVHPRYAPAASLRHALGVRFFLGSFVFFLSEAAFLNVNKSAHILVRGSSTRLSVTLARSKEVAYPRALLWR